MVNYILLIYALIGNWFFVSAMTDKGIDKLNHPWKKRLTIATIMGIFWIVFLSWTIYDVYRESK